MLYIRSVFPNAFIYLEVYGLLAPAILSIAAMTCRVLCITREQLRDIQRLQRAVANRECRRRMEMRYAFCVAAVSLAFLTCWVPYIVYTHVGMEFLLRRGGKSNPPATLCCPVLASRALLSCPCFWDSPTGSTQIQSRNCSANCGTATDIQACKWTLAFVRRCD